jgi:methylated-DNA-[protein]-cysteine S-methyltransferase
VAASVLYEVEGWGVGEIWLDGETLLWHELPREPVSRTQPSESPLHELADRLRMHFTGARDSFADVPIDLDGLTAFQVAVIDALRRVPWGEVVTYGELAALAGHPNAQRAAGSVCAHNRFPLIVPCHRVVAADGIGRYGLTGVGYKRRLLELENVSF